MCHTFFANKGLNDLDHVLLNLEISLTKKKMKMLADDSKLEMHQTVIYNGHSSM